MFQATDYGAMPEHALDNKLLAIFSVKMMSDDLAEVRVINIMKFPDIERRVGPGTPRDKSYDVGDAAEPFYEDNVRAFQLVADSFVVRKGRAIPGALLIQPLDDRIGEKTETHFRTGRLIHVIFGYYIGSFARYLNRMIVDRLGRRFLNLRVSLTAACNYACTYCVPDGKKLMPARNEMQATELLTAVQLLQQAVGIEQVRITGGEPLLTPKFDEFLTGVMALPLSDVSLTTNGQLLPRKADLIVNSGMKRINVSLDTLNPERFKRIARGGDLETVLHGIDLMLDAGLKVKINMVPMRTQNAGEIVPMLEYCLERGIELRFIELMRMGHLLNSNGFVADYVSMESLLDMIGAVYQFERTGAPHDSTAVRFDIHGKGVFGIIANESEPFCRSCTRLRLSSDGRLYGCLSNSRYQSMSDLIALPVHEALPRLQHMLVSALDDKKLSFQGETTVMKFIGG